MIAFRDTAHPWTERPREDAPVTRRDLGAASLACRHCGGRVGPGIALLPGIYGTEDFGGDYGQLGTTMTEGPGDGRPRRCLKCADCGHSFIPASAPAYTREPEQARAFVSGILEGASPERALDVIEHHCAERGLDSTLLIEALAALTDSNLRP